MKKQNRISKSFRLNRSTVALLETYSREQDMSMTDVVELAIKRLCRESQTPATQKDFELLRQELTLGFETLSNRIQNQPIQVLPEPTKKVGFWTRLFGE